MRRSVPVTPSPEQHTREVSFPGLPRINCAWMTESLSWLQVLLRLGVGLDAIPGVEHRVEPLLAPGRHLIREVWTARVARRAERRRPAAVVPVRQVEAVSR